MRSRAIRRHHEERIKQRVKSYYCGYAKKDPRSIGMIAHSRKLCSCWMCGNPRKYFKHRTLQEIKALERARLMPPQADDSEGT